MTGKPITLAERQRKAKRWREWERKRRERERTPSDSGHLVAPQEVETRADPSSYAEARGPTPSPPGSWKGGA